MIESNFKIGQVVTCGPVDEDDFFFERLIIGHSYLIEDIDYHFPDKICIKLNGPYYFHSEFVPDKYFKDSISKLRDERINSILKD